MTCVRACVATCLAWAIMAGPCRAGFVVGTQVFESTATLSLSDQIDVSATAFLINVATLPGMGRQAGDMVGKLGAFTYLLDTNNLIGSEIGSEAYGKFVVQDTIHNSLLPGISRSLHLSGVFVPGVLTFGPDFDPTPGVFSIVLLQSAFGRQKILHSSHALAVGPLPEPARDASRAVAVPELSTLSAVLVFMGLSAGRMLVGAGLGPKHSATRDPAVARAFADWK